MPDSIIDILIPVYNGAQTIRESINSIRAQTIRSIRIVVVDDGSIDSTQQILRGLASEDARLLVINKSNSGIVDTLNLGLQHCQAEFVARFDADDIAYPHRLATQISYLRDHPEVVAVGCAVEHIDEGGLPIIGLPHPGQPRCGDPSRIPAREPYIIHPFLTARRSVIALVGGYRHVHNSEDSDLYWRLLEHGTLYNLEESLGQYRMHNSSVSGASIVSGRIMAICSQLAALSALRRRNRKPDINFEHSARNKYYAASSLQNIYELARAGLDDNEATHLRIAAGAKLLELTNYRPYELERSDCTFIRKSLDLAAGLSQKNRRELYWLLSVGSARLARKGKIGDTVALTPGSSYPVVALRLIGKMLAFR